MKVIMLEKQKDKMPKIDPTKLTKEIKNKYSVVSNAFRLSGGKKEKVKDGKPKDLIITEVGDVKQEEFYPQVKIGRWGDNDDTNEVNLSVRLIDNEIGKETLATENYKIKWSKGNKTARFYEIEPNDDYPEGAFEFDIELAQKPKTNKIGFSLNTKGVDFYLQPRMDAGAVAEEKSAKDGVLVDWSNNDWIAKYYNENDRKEGYTETTSPDGFRPENVVGSYPVYYKNCPANVIYPIDKSKYTLEELNQMVLAGTHFGKINKKGELDYFEYGKEYKVGKVGHIYRPEIYDASGASVWGILSIDKEAGKLTVEIPQEFLDKAVYPVVIDPTFGYTTVGGTGYTSSKTLYTFPFSATENGTLSSLSISTAEFDSGDKMCVIIYDSSNRIDYTAEQTSDSSSGTKYWLTNDVIVGASISAGTYYLGFFQSLAMWNFYYDDGSPIHGAYQNIASYSYPPPATWTKSTSSAYRKLSVYATYTAGGGETTRTPRQGFINLSTMSVC